MDTKALRREVRRFGPSRRGRRFPTEVRGRLVAAVCALRAEGAGWATIGERLGISGETARRYYDDSPGLRPVEVAATSEADAPLSLVTPMGLRLEGLTVERAAALLRMLSS